jgi:uncharacterized protein with von Willebrand factor type A (vWA) domain
MSDDRIERIQQVFCELRRERLTLGIDELLAALEAEQEGLGGETADELKGMLALLWCKSEAERGCLGRTWETLERQAVESPLDRQRSVEPSGDTEPGEISRKTSPAPVKKPTVAEASREAFGIVPTRAPTLPPMREELTELQHYYPVSRREMQYAWRYLRRMIADGPRDALDVAATVAQTARQGFYYAPVWQRRERNHAHLLLLLDHLGSMVPVHHYLRDLAETARYESPLGQVDVYYFYNVPGAALYTDPLLTQEPQPLHHIVQSISEFTAALIVSDAGAARRHHELDRVLAALECLDTLRAVTPYVAWLNPMPEVRWRSTSAEVIARQVAMFPMSPDGLSNAVDVLRGLRPSTPT